MSRVSLKPGIKTLACAAGLALAATLAAPTAAVTVTPPTPDPYGYLPATIRVTGVVRDFRKFNVPGGHPDFEQYNTSHRVGLVQNQLDSDGKPVMASRVGRTVNTQFRDAQGRNIMPSLYDSSRGDIAGTLTTPSSSAIAITSADSFRQWFRDVPGVNLSKTHAITLTRRAGTNIYVFHEEDDNNTPQREGFFPADGDLFNDWDPTYNHNYHFTFELSTRFTYKRGMGQTFRFVGDDDVWVFIDGKLAIDVGGVHSAIDQFIDLDRFADLHNLQDGQEYTLKFFFAERRTTRSNCRIETSLTLRNAELPATSALYD